MDELRQRFDRLREDLSRHAAPELRAPSGPAEDGARSPGKASLPHRAAISASALALAGLALMFAWVTFRQPEKPTTNPAPAGDSQTLSIVTRSIGRDGPRAHVFEVDSAGVNAYLIADLPDTTFAALSPDGTRVAFTRVGPQRGLWIADSDGGNPQRLYESTPNNVFTPAWSPDGSWIAFGNNRVGHDELFLVHPDGTGLRQLTTNEQGGDFFPSWAPDGSQIAFSRNAAGTRGLYGVELQTGDVSPIAAILSARESTWSPDGRSLVVAVSDESHSPSPFEIRDLYRIDLATGRQTRLTNTPTVNERLPSYSAAGRLGYLRGAAGSTEIVISDEASASPSAAPFDGAGEASGVGWTERSPAGALIESILDGSSPLGDRLAAELGLPLLPSFPPVGGCQSYQEVEESGAGYCLEGLTIDRAGRVVIADALSGHRMTQAQLDRVRETLAQV